MPRRSGSGALFTTTCTAPGITPLKMKCGGQSATSSAEVRCRTSRSFHASWELLLYGERLSKCIKAAYREPCGRYIPSRKTTSYYRRGETISISSHYN